MCSGSEWRLSTKARLSELVTDPLRASRSGLLIEPFWLSSGLSTTQIKHSCAHNAQLIKHNTVDFKSCNFAQILTSAGFPRKQILQIY